jgi:hypothetical protein
MRGSALCVCARAHSREAPASPSPPPAERGVGGRCGGDGGGRREGAEAGGADGGVDGGGGAVGGGALGRGARAAEVQAAQGRVAQARAEDGGEGGHGAREGNRWVCGWMAPQPPTWVIEPATSPLEPATCTSLNLTLLGSIVQWLGHRPLKQNLCGTILCCVVVLFGFEGKASLTSPTSQTDQLRSTLNTAHLPKACGSSPETWVRIPLEPAINSFVRVDSTGGRRRASCGVVIDLLAPRTTGLTTRRPCVRRRPPGTDKVALLDLGLERS